MSTVTAVRTANRILQEGGVVRGPRSVAIVHGIMGSRTNRRSIRQSLELRKWSKLFETWGQKERGKSESPSTLRTSVRHVSYRQPQRRKFLAKNL